MGLDAGLGVGLGVGLGGADGAVAGQPWWDPGLPADVRAALAVGAMTMAEKLSFVSGPIALPGDGRAVPTGALGSAGYFPGVARLGIPPMQQTDASLGVTNPGAVRTDAEATALPSSLLLAASFDPATARETGAVVGREARAAGFHVVLGGGANLVRDPRCGRAFEYVSEDPLLTGVMAGHSIAGIQSARVVSTIKHYLLNAQETGRVVVSSDLDEAAMRESDLLAFQIGIEIGRPGAVMTSYNRVNGVYTAESAFLIETVLKGDWGFPGWVMSDWGGTHSTVASALAGLDVESGDDLLAETYFAGALAAAVETGAVPAARIDDMVRRVLRSLFALGVADDPPVAGRAVDFVAHRAVAQRAAERGIVLLKNRGGALPATGLERVLVIGAHADQGVLAGGGSSEVVPLGSVRPVASAGESGFKLYHPSSPVAAIRAAGMAARVEYCDGRDVDAAVAAARGADLVVVFAEAWRSEGYDAVGLGLPGAQDALIAAVAAGHGRVVVVLEVGGAVAMPWLDAVAAVLVAFYPGAGGGQAIAGVLSGRVNPSGRLPLTFPAREQDLPRPAQRDPATTTPDPGEAHAHEMFRVSYDIEGSDVGYRWFARTGVAPLFPFGFGLSYTRFALSDLVLTPGLDGVRVVVANEGARAGATVVQVYVGLEDGFVPRLAGFARVELGAGERRELVIALEGRVVASYDVGAGGFRVASGVYEVMVGQHAGDPHGLVEHVTLGDA